MESPLETECRQAIAQSFDLLTDKLTCELQGIIQAANPPSTHLLWFVFDSSQFDEGFPVVVCRMDQNGQCEENRQLLPKTDAAVPESIIYDPRYRAEELDTWAIASEILRMWFADCWEAAGGHQSRWPGYLAHHDSSYSFDLTRRRELKSPEPQYPGV